MVLKSPKTQKIPPQWGWSGLTAKGKVLGLLGSVGGVLGQAAVPVRGRGFGEVTGVELWP